jgi:hypothetical protein
LAFQVLEGAVAYRSDCIRDYVKEIASWRSMNPNPITLECSTKGCTGHYMMYVPLDASNATIQSHKDALRRMMEKSCPYHANRIRFNPLAQNYRAS